MTIRDQYEEYAQHQRVLTNLNISLAEGLMRGVWYHYLLPPFEEDRGYNCLAVIPEAYKSHRLEDLFIYNRMKLGKREDFETGAHCIPNYSSDLVESFKVVKAMQELGYGYCLERLPSHVPASNTCIFYLSQKDPRVITAKCDSWIGSGKNEPEAICDAALKAVTALPPLRPDPCIHDRIEVFYGYMLCVDCGLMIHHEEENHEEWQQIYKNAKEHMFTDYCHKEYRPK